MGETTGGTNWMDWIMGQAGAELANRRQMQQTEQQSRLDLAGQVSASAPLANKLATPSWVMPAMVAGGALVLFLVVRSAK